MKRSEIAAERRVDAALIKLLVGRTIVKAEPNGSVEGDNKTLARWMHTWVLTLDDGAELRFFVEEHPDGDDYGVDIVRRGPPQREKT